MTAHDPYADLPLLYDLQHEAFDDDLALYGNIAEAVGDPILEVGCGTGRVLVPLAEAGFRVTGLDLSGPMLEAARVACAEAGVGDRVALHEAPMTAADGAPGGPFGLVLAPLDALLHAGDAADQRATLAAARRAMDPRGQLVIDVFNPTPEALAALERGVVHEGSWRLPDDTRVDKFGSRRVHPARQAIVTDLWYDLAAPDGSLRRVRTSYELRYLHRAELELMLELAGFVEWEVYGGYDLEPFEDGSDRIVMTAEATRSR